MTGTAGFGLSVKLPVECGEAADGGRGEKNREEQPRDQHSGGQIAVQIAEVIPENCVHTVREQLFYIAQQLARREIDPTQKSGDADQNGEKGEDEEVGKMGGGAADVL